MAITINGSGTIGGISVGGLNNSIITKDELASSWAPAGTVIQVVQGKLSSTFTAAFSGNNFATVTGLAATITPASANSKILVMLNMYVGNIGATNGYQNECQILRNGSVVTAFNGDPEGGRQGVASRLNMHLGNSFGAYVMGNLSGSWLDSPASTSPQTYAVQARNYSAGSPIYVNRQEIFQNGGLDYDGVPQSTITLFEIAG